MSQMYEDEPAIGSGETIEAAAEEAAKKIGKEIQHETYLLAIYAELSGEHNPIHAYKVVLSPGP
jgi:hypothetical protein